MPTSARFFVLLESVTPVVAAVLYVPGAMNRRFGLLGRRAARNASASKRRSDRVIRGGVSVERRSVRAGVTRIQQIVRGTRGLHRTDGAENNERKMTQRCEAPTRK